MLKPPESICTMPYIKDVNPYKGTMFEKYLLNKPAIYEQDGEKIVVYHFVDFNSTEYFPVQVMLHPQLQFRGYYKIPHFKMFHFPKKNQSNYFELVVKNVDPSSNVDKIDQFKNDLIKKGFLTEEEFHMFVEDRINYYQHIKKIETSLDFTLSN